VHQDFGGLECVEGPLAAIEAGSDREKAKRSGSDLAKRYPVALAMYAVLAVLVWFTMSDGKVLVMGRPVELRLLPLLIIAGLALRTVVAQQADKIRHRE
jgi:hypothetical protein